MKLHSRTEPPPPAFDVLQTRIGPDLKLVFDTLTAGPMPDRLVRLAQALEDALERGEVRMEPGRRLN